MANAENASDELFFAKHKLMRKKGTVDFSPLLRLQFVLVLAYRSGSFTVCPRPFTMLR